MYYAPHTINLHSSGGNLRGERGSAYVGRPLLRNLSALKRKEARNRSTEFCWRLWCSMSACPSARCTRVFWRRRIRHVRCRCCRYLVDNTNKIAWCSPFFLLLTVFSHSVFIHSFSLWVNFNNSMSKLYETCTNPV